MLESLRKVSNLINISYQSQPFGNLCSIQGPKMTVQYDAIKDHENAILFVIHIYTEGSYIVSYIEVDKDGEIVEVWGETEGVLPRLFYAPDKSIWTCLTYLKTPKDSEISIPLHGRERVQKLKTTREFSGKYLGTTQELSLLYNDDTGKGMDRLCKLIFDKDGRYKQRKIVKIPAPERNQAYLDSKGQLHLLKAESGTKRLHRLLDLDGNVLKERTISTEAYFIAILHLDFEGPSSYVCTGDNKLYHERVATDGTVVRKFLIEIEAIKEYFSWVEPATWMGSERTLFKFNSDAGPGWFIMEGDSLLECFISDDDIQGFCDLVSGKTIELGYEHIVVAAIEAFDKDSYSILFHQSSRDYNRMEILTRTVGQ